MIPGGDNWAVKLDVLRRVAAPTEPDADKVAPIRMPIPGPGMSRESLALLPRPRVSRHRLGLAGAGAAGCLVGMALAAVLPLGVATVVSLALLVATVAGARAWGADRVPTARWLKG